VNGDVYDGFFLHGQFHGQGEYRFKKSEFLWCFHLLLSCSSLSHLLFGSSAGGSYKGSFREGLFWGKGKETYPDGTHSHLTLSLPLCCCALASLPFLLSLSLRFLF
jgi:hypothetical protein